MLPVLSVFEGDVLDKDFCPLRNVVDMHKKLRIVRLKLLKLYNDEFLSLLLKKTTDEKSRYSPQITHNAIEIGDLVILKEEHVKPTNMPMARVESITRNNLGETKGAVVFKGTTREQVKSHASLLLPLLRDKTTQDSE